MKNELGAKIMTKLAAMRLKIYNYLTNQVIKTFLFITK